MPSQEKILEREIRQLKELKAFEELPGEYGFNEMVNLEKQATISLEIVSKYGDLTEEQLQEHIDRLEQDLKDLKVQNGTLFGDE